MIAKLSSSTSRAGSVWFCVPKWLLLAEQKEEAAVAAVEKSKEVGEGITYILEYKGQHKNRQMCAAAVRKSFSGKVFIRKLPPENTEQPRALAPF